MGIAEKVRIFLDDNGRVNFVDLAPVVPDDYRRVAFVLIPSLHALDEPPLAAMSAPTAVILLGDLQAKRPPEVELSSILDLTDIWFIHGNHDSESETEYEHLFGSKLANRSLHGKVVEVAGWRIAGLGGVFRGKVWSPP